MKPYYQDDFVTLYHGDCLELSDVWTCGDVMVTDPPYGRSWKQGDTKTALGGKDNRHAGIANDGSTEVRDQALSKWGDKPGIAFGDLMLPPPERTKLVGIYYKTAPNAGILGAVAGCRRDAEAIYFLGKWGTGIGGGSSVFPAYLVGGGAGRPHPHMKPLDVLIPLIELCPPGVIVDPFAGSGSTLRAAKDLGRKAVGVELEEKYCEIAANRCAQEVLFGGG